MMDYVRAGFVIGLFMAIILLIIAYIAPGIGQKVTG